MKEEHKNLIFNILITGLSSAILGSVLTGGYLIKKLNTQLPEFKEEIIREERPLQVRYSDLNADGKGDIVIYTQNRTNIFIQNNLGGYTPFEKYIKDARDNLEADSRVISNKLEEKFSEIERKAGELKSLGARR